MTRLSRCDIKRSLTSEYFLETCNGCFGYKGRKLRFYDRSILACHDQKGDRLRYQNPETKARMKREVIKESMAVFNLVISKNLGDL